MTFKRRIASAALAAAVALCAPAVLAPSPALAVTSAELQAQLDEAKATLDEMGSQVAAVGEDLNDTIYQLQQTEDQIGSVRADIDKRTKELADDRAQLAERVSTDYKSGGVSFLSLLVNSATFEDFVNNVYYADKISQNDADAIAAVNQAKSELEAQEQQLVDLQSEQQSLKEQQEAQKADLEKKQAEQQRYVNELDEQVKQKIEEERQAELERQRREAEAARAAAEEAARQAAAAEEARAAQSSQGSSQGSFAPSSSGSAVSAGARSAIVNAAYSQLGVPYVYGAYSPGRALDCSGFTRYCYSAAGISIPHSAAAQSSMARKVSRADLQPGDLVFWIGGVSGSASGNHVGLYIGNDQIIHANGTRVVLDTLSGRRAYTSAGPIGL